MHSFQTQAVFDERVMEKLQLRSAGNKVPVMAGVILLKSEKMANYMNKNVPGIFVPKYY